MSGPEFVDLGRGVAGVFPEADPVLAYGLTVRLSPSGHPVGPVGVACSGCGMSGPEFVDLGRGVAGVFPDADPVLAYGLTVRLTPSGQPMLDRPALLIGDAA